MKLNGFQWCAETTVLTQFQALKQNLRSEKAFNPPTAHTYGSVIFNHIGLFDYSLNAEKLVPVFLTFQWLTTVSLCSWLQSKHQHPY